MITMTREQALQDLVNEETSKGRDLGAESQAVIDEIEEDQRIDRRRALTTKDRLKRRLLTGYVEIPFKDDLGEFNVKMRLPSPGQRKRFLQLQIEIDHIIQGNITEEPTSQSLWKRLITWLRGKKEEPTKTIEERTEEELDRIDAEMCDILGHLCMDFDADYIRSGENFSVDIIQKLMQVIVGFEPVKMEDYQFFRSPP